MPFRITLVLACLAQPVQGCRLQDTTERLQGVPLRLSDEHQKLQNIGSAVSKYNWWPERVRERRPLKTFAMLALAFRLPSAWQAGSIRGLVTKTRIRSGSSSVLQHHRSSLAKDVAMASVPVEVDGSYREGGGQILRNAMVFSCLLGEPVKVVKIRHNRPKPGLANSHLEAISLIQDICDGELEGAELRSTEVTLQPRGSSLMSPAKLMKGELESLCSTAGSISLMIQAALFPALLVGARRIRFTGGTDVDFAPPVGYLQDVLLPTYEKLFFKEGGLQPELVINKRGYFPEGGGIADLNLQIGAGAESGEVPCSIFPLPNFTWTASSVEGGTETRTPLIEVHVRCYGSLPKKDEVWEHFQRNYSREFLLQRILQSGPPTKKFTENTGGQSSASTVAQGSRRNNDLRRHFLFPGGPEGVRVVFELAPDLQSRRGSGGFGVNILLKSADGALFYGSAVDSMKRANKLKAGKKVQNSKSSGKRRDSGHDMVAFCSAVFERAMEDLQNCLWHCVVDSECEPSAVLPVDPHLQDNLILPMALAHGISKLACSTDSDSRLTEHSRAAMYVAEKMTGCKFWEESSRDAGVRFLCCDGIGFFVKFFVVEAEQWDSKLEAMLFADFRKLEHQYARGCLKIDVSERMQGESQVVVRVRGNQRFLDEETEVADWSDGFAEVLERHRIRRPAAELKQFDSKRRASSGPRSGSAFWLVKNEPEEYSFADLLRDGRTVWDGVRNAQAKNSLALMQVGDQVLYYHSGTKTKGVAGIASVARTAYPDPTVKQASNPWLAVDLVPLRELTELIPLVDMKANKKLNSLQLFRQPRLSVMPVTKDEFDEIVRMSGS